LKHPYKKVLNTIIARKHFVRSHSIHVTFTLLLAMFLYKAWWRPYWAKRCSSFV